METCVEDEQSQYARKGSCLRTGGPGAHCAKVSTADQSYELQLLDLHDYAARRGWEITGVYQDVISGSKSDRPGLNRLREDARARRFHCLLVWKLGRFGRSLVDCLNSIQILEDHGIRFVAVTQGLARHRPSEPGVPVPAACLGRRDGI